MNIFKILANGDGTINEANVSAFLGYLLDPKADHALGFEFLKRFLEPVLDREEFTVEKYDYQVFYEQAFKETDASKQIVDVVIVGYSTDQGTGRESLVKEFMRNSKKVEKLFLIENKIRTSSITEGQLQKQFLSTLAELKGDLKEDQIHSIYVTPESEKLKLEFESAEILNKTHILWDSKEADDLSIKSMLKNLLHLEQEGEIEALNLYTSQTVKAFIQFIATDFRSEKAEEKRRREPSQARLDAEELNQRMKVEDHLLSLRQNIATSRPAIADNLSLPDLSNPGFPKLEIAYKGIILQIASFSATREKVSFWFTIDRNVAESRQHLEIFATKTDLELKKPNDTYGSYLRTVEMKKHIPFSDPDKIVEVVKNSLDLLDKHLA